MRLMQRVLWTKGVLLSPQHLQVQDRFIEDLIGFQVASLALSPWGFSRLGLDHEALAGGSLGVSDAAGILPDGLPFDMPGSDPVPPPKPLEEYWHPDMDSLDLYLTLPEHRVGALNVAPRIGDASARYVAEVALLRDENTGKQEKPIQIARKNFRILCEGEPLEGSTALPLARVTRTEAGVFELDPQHVPPLLDIAASEAVMAVARRLVELLSAKSGALSGSRRQRGKGLADFGVADIANFWLLYTVNTHLPLFRHLFETRRGHPAQLYAAMLELAGSLSTFSTRIQPRDLPPYDHGDLAGCLFRLDAMLRDLLDTVVPANHVALPLKRTEPSVYATAIDQDRYFTGDEFYIAFKASMKQDDLLRKVPQLVKVSAGDQIGRLIRQALPGVGTRHVPNPPSALPVKLDYHYFVLDRTGDDWDAVRRARNLAVYVPSDFPDPQLELVILLPPESGA